jgi:hypothetical protein
MNKLNTISNSNAKIIKRYIVTENKKLAITPKESEKSDYLVIEGLDIEPLKAITIVYEERPFNL